MITKIISSGQGGVEQAALDLAIKMDISHGGWTTEKITKDINGKFSLNIIKSKDKNECVEKNIRQADGTLVLYRRKSPASLFSLLKKTTKKLNKPCLLVNLNKISKFECALNINKWITDENIQTLFVSGEHITNQNKTYQDVMDILESTLYLNQVELSTPLSAGELATPKNAPKTVKEAVACLLETLPLKDRVLIANMTFGELAALNVTLGSYIRDNFGVWTGNEPLLESCREYEGKNDLPAETVSVVIIQALWEELKKTHRLRVVKTQ